MRGAFGVLAASLLVVCVAAFSADALQPHAAAARVSRAQPSAKAASARTGRAKHSRPHTSPAFTPPPIKHVFVIVDENESASAAFGPSSPARYLSKTLRSQGAYLQNYYAIGHNSLDNYIAMVSGQAPNPLTSADCSSYVGFSSLGLLDGQQTGAGCLYPANVPSLMSQLDTAHLTWRAYEDGMGADPARDNAAQPSDPNCGHPAISAPDPSQTETPTDQYAAKHDPFVYFHYVIDNQADCNADVVPLTRLQGDLHSASTTPNFVFITPGLCDDGHDAPCANGKPGGLPQADAFLRTIVPEITASAAFKQSGLLLITFDEAAQGDTSSCCNETAGPFNSANGAPAGGAGPGGGVVGAVLLSPYIKPGTVSTTAYDHYSMLGSVEGIFGLSRLGEATAAPAFGTDVYSRPDGTSASMPAELTAELSGEITPSTSLPPRTMATSGYPLPFETPEPGEVVVQWYTVPPGAAAARAHRDARTRGHARSRPKPMLVASATEAFAQPGTATLRLAPTTAALKLLERSRSLRLRATGTFITRQRKRVTVSKTFVLR